MGKKNGISKIKIFDSKKAKSLIRKNLKQCCKEIDDWLHKGILVDGIVREISSKYTMDDIRMTERLIYLVAIKKIANEKNQCSKDRKGINLTPSRIRSIQ